MWTQQFTSDWNRMIATPPIAESLKIALTEKWVRLHYFEGSKRYPTLPADEKNLLEKFNQVISHLDPKELVIITTDWNGIYDGSVFWQTIHDGIADISGERNLYISKVDWGIGVVDTLVKDVALDKIAGVIITTMKLDWIVHPYDGGLDLIVMDEKRKESLRTSLKDLHLSQNL